MSDTNTVAVREATVSNQDGLHARPVMKFIQMACTYRSRVRVTNLTHKGESVDGKSAMHMMLLEASKGCVLRIEASGDDAAAAVAALAALVTAGFEAE